MSPLRRGAALAVAALLLAAPLLANGGTVRISRAPVGPYLVSVFSSPTPLRTGEVDISVLVQDSANAAQDVPIRVEARPVGFEAPAVRHPATRQQATNKLFKAAKFPVTVPGEWEFTVWVGAEADGAGAGGAAAAGAGAAVSFRATLTEPTILDRPYLLAALIVLPLAVLGWLLLGRGED